MFKKSLLFTLLMAFAAPLAMWGQNNEPTRAIIYERITSAPSDWTVGHYLLVYEADATSGNAFNGTLSSGSGQQVAVSISSGVINSYTGTAEITFEESDESGYFLIKNSSSNKYLYASSTSLYEGTSSGNQYKWTFSVASDGKVSIYNKYTKNNLKYNARWYFYPGAALDVYLYEQKTSTIPSINVAPATAKIMEDEEVVLTATTDNVEGTPTISWTTTDASIASISSNTGSSITVTGVTEGVATITASITVDETVYTSSCTVTVSNDILMEENGSITTCTGTFYDDGGSTGDYKTGYHDIIYTIYPGTTGKMIQAAFTSFAVENWSTDPDYLEIYDGISTSAPLLKKYTDDYNGSSFTETATNDAGALTFHFVTDGSGVAAGWAATISCVDPASYELVAASDVTHNSAKVNWTGGTENFTVEYKKHSDSEWTTASTTVSTRFYELTGLVTETAYDVRVTDANNNVISEDNYFTTLATPLAFTTATGIDSNTATVNWTGGKANYRVEYKPNGTSTWILAGENISTTSCELTALSTRTSYDVRVTDALNSILEQESYFTTECGAYAIPYSYGFETATDMDCWSTSGATTQTGIYSTTGHNNSTKVFKFHYSQTDVQYLISPELSGVPTYGVKVTFYYKLPYTSNPETFKVGYSTTDNAIASFEGNWDDEISYQSTAWKEYSHVFPAETKYIAINYTAIDKYQLYIDDISFEPYAEYTKGITGYTQIGGDDENEVGWYLIASPVLSVTPTEENGFLANDYDFYRFNQNPTVSSDGEYKEWENYKTHNFVIESGKGYLYANSGNVTLQFAGVPYSGDGKVDLVYSASNGNDDEKMLGWNLVGNPFGTAATVSMNYYRLGQESRNLIAGTNGTTVEAMEGILVKAGGEGENVTFIPATQNANTNSDALVVMNLTQNRGTVIDRAIVRFNENGNQLPKFMLDKNNTKIYIPQNGEDFAIAYSNAQGEMPVNFKARENGTYTLSVNAENVEMNYLHLIDNMTGADIDLLQTPSYTFNATTRDYESRFRLVFSANGENGASTGSATFAFYSNGNLIVSNEGQATLQVVDVMGRVLSSETIEGSHSMSLNVAPGVYMIRLINGNNVKVQKIVVR